MKTTTVAADKLKRKRKKTPNQSVQHAKRGKLSAGQKTVAQLQSKAAKRTESINLPVSCFVLCSARLRGARCFNCVSTIVRLAVTRGHISFIVSLGVSNALFPLLRFRTEPSFFFLALQSSCNCIDTSTATKAATEKTIVQYCC